MSDNEYYSSDNNSDTDSSSDIEEINHDQVIHKNKKLSFRTSKLNINDYENNSDLSDDDTINDDDDDNDSYIDDDDLKYAQYGGNDSDNENENYLVKDSEDNDEDKQQRLLNDIEDDDDEDDEDDDKDENYLQKYNSEINKNYIDEFHPECHYHNFDEINKLSKIIVDDNNIICDPFHKTLPFLTRYERARIIGQRAKQIENGARPFIQLKENIIDSYIIAEMELKNKMIPFIIRRPIPGGGFEYWRVKDLENLNF
jgi:DNA-directed RNA polymerase subunit K/omega